MDIDIEKLERLFEERFLKFPEELQETTPSLPSRSIGTEFWVDYCDKHKILMLHPEWLCETLNKGLGDRICIDNYEVKYLTDAGVIDAHEGCPWLLVPRKFAERALILGGLP